MDVQKLLFLILLGLVAGALGQALRVVVGVKKASEEAAAGHQTLKQAGIDFGRIGLSLLIGAVAGALAILGSTGFSATAADTITPQLFFGVLGAGYAGADFIEGFIRKQVPALGGNPPVGAKVGG